MEPLFDDHFVDGFPIVVLLMAGLELTPLGILQLDDAVTDTSGHNRHETQQQASVDVRHLTSGEVVVSGEEVARCQRRGVELRRLRARIVLSEEENVFLDLALADVERGADDIVEGDAPDVLDLGRREHTVADVLEPEAVRIADASELLFDDRREERTRSMSRFQHSTFSYSFF